MPVQAGVYRHRPGGRRYQWDGQGWARRYWNRWRIPLTAAWIVAAAFVEFAFMGALLGDPGQGGDTAQFERGKNIGAAGFFLWPLFAIGVWCMLNWPLVRTALRERKLERQAR